MPIVHIRGNDPSFTHLKLVNPPQYHFRGSPASVFADAFQVNTTIEYVRFDRDFFPGLEPDERRILIKRVGELRKLKELHLWNGDIEVSILAEALKDCPGLETLGLGKVNLLGNAEDFLNFQSSLTSHQKLTEFSLVDFHVAEENVSIDAVLLTLASVKTLRTVKIEPAKDATAHFTSAAIGPLCKADNLVVLSFARFKLSLDHFALLSDHIKSTDKLKEVSLINVGMCDDSAKLIADAISTNASVQLLDLSSNLIGNEGCIAIARGLATNKCLKNLRLWGNKSIQSEGLSALVVMLETNQTLERVETPMVVDRTHKMKIDEALEKNRNGAVSSVA